MGGWVGVGVCGAGWSDGELGWSPCHLDYIHLSTGDEGPDNMARRERQDVENGMRYRTNERVLRKVGDSISKWGFCPHRGITSARSGGRTEAVGCRREVVSA